MKLFDSSGNEIYIFFETSGNEYISIRIRPFQTRPVLKSSSAKAKHISKLESVVSHEAPRQQPDLYQSTGDSVEINFACHLCRLYTKGTDRDLLPSGGSSSRISSSFGPEPGRVLLKQGAHKKDQPFCRITLEICKLG